MRVVGVQYSKVRGDLIGWNDTIGNWINTIKSMASRHASSRNSQISIGN